MIITSYTTWAQRTTTTKAKEERDGQGKTNLDEGEGASHDEDDKEDEDDMGDEDNRRACSISTKKKQTPRFLIFCHWPMVMWVTEMFLDALGVEHVTIRSSMSPEPRTIAANKFTSRDSRCDVLITTFNFGATGLNLHENCSRVIVLEPALNINTLLQSVGRVAKGLGQTEPQKVWILFQDHTICRYLEASSTKKALPQIAAELHGTIREFVGETTGDTVKDSGANEQNDDNESAATDVDEGEGENASGARRNKRAEERIIDRTCAEHIQNLLGQRVSRLGMDDVKALRLKKCINLTLQRQTFWPC